MSVLEVLDAVVKGTCHGVRDDEVAQGTEEYFYYDSEDLHGVVVQDTNGNKEFVEKNDITDHYNVWFGWNGDPVRVVPASEYLLKTKKASKEKKKKDAVYKNGAIKKTSSKKKKDDDELTRTKLQEEVKKYHGTLYGIGLNPWD